MFGLFTTPVLRIRNFRFFLLNKFLLTFGVQMIGFIVGWQVYQLTRDPLALGLIGLSEAIAFIATSFWSGHISDQREKRQLILWAEAAIFLCAAALWLFTYRGNTQTLPIYGMVALSGIARAFLWASSTTYSQMIVPKEIYSSAAAWNSTVWEIASIAGPAAGGLLYGLIGARGAYEIAVLCIGGSMVFAMQLAVMPPVRVEKKETLWQSLTSGMRFVLSHQVLLGAMALDMFAVLFGGVVAILPAFAEILKIGPAGVGVLRASQSVGAIMMAMFQTRRPAFQNTGRTLFIAVAAFGVCTIAFGLSKNFYLSMFLLALAGAADNISVIIRASILQATTPDAMRGRVSAVDGIFIGSSNEIGAFESGLAAKLLGVVPSVIFGGTMTLITVASTMFLAPKLRNIKSIKDLS